MQLPRKPSKTAVPRVPLSPAHRFDAKQIASAIGKKIPNMRVAMAPTGAPETAPEHLPGYFNAVAARLYRMWAQPDRAEVGSANPTVSVRIVVDRDGRVRGAGIRRPSGISAMDSSVRAVLARLHRLPPPRDYGLRSRTLSIDITFKLD